MSVYDRADDAAAALRKCHEALALQLSELEDLRDQVARAEQNAKQQKRSKNRNALREYEQA
jgi:hypothetical protein